ncbi:MAG: hypothetical protein AAGA58_00310 [Verrucomicrobiota bacterium]
MEFSKNSERSIDPLAKILGSAHAENKAAGRDSKTAGSGGKAPQIVSIPPRPAEDSFADAVGQNGSEDPLEAIRKAVFGDRIEGLSHEVNRIESELIEHRDEIKKHVAEGFSSFEKFLRREMTSASEKINSDVAEKVREMKETKESVERKIRETEERMLKVEKETKAAQDAAAEELSQRSASLAKQIEETGRRVYERVSNELADMDSKLTDRFTLGDVLREMGDRLSRDQAKAS